MTIPAYSGLQTALRGLEANQVGIDTTGHNIANANTPGYTRQSAVLTESPSLTIPAFSNVTGAGVQLGQGVDVSQISRIRDQFIDIQYRAQNTGSSNSRPRLPSWAGPDSGQRAVDRRHLGGAVELLGPWRRPGQQPHRAWSHQTAVIEAGQTLAQTFNSIDRRRWRPSSRRPPISTTR